MDKIGWSILAVALIWAAVILAVSMTLEGTPYVSQVTRLLAGGAAATIIVLGGSLRMSRKKERGQ